VDVEEIGEEGGGEVVADGDKELGAQPEQKQITYALQELQSSDPSLWQSLTWILNADMDAEEAPELFFSVGDEGADGRKVDVELTPGGAEKRVTNKNKVLFVRAHLDWSLRLRARPLVSSLARGLWAVLPCEALLQLTGAELRLLLCGTGTHIDLADWRANTLYTNGYTPSHLVVQWFWEWLRASSDDTRLSLLSFVTGSKNIPAGGFADLQGPDAPHRFTIQRSVNASRLPSAHTCFNVLVLPEYGSKSVMEGRLASALNHTDDGLLLT